MRALTILIGLALLVVAAGAEDIPPADYAEPLPVMVLAETPAEPKPESEPVPEAEPKPESEPVPEAERKPETTVYAYVYESDAIARMVLDAGLSRMPERAWRWSPVGIQRHTGRISEVEAFRRTVEAEARRARLREVQEARRARR